MYRIPATYAKQTNGVLLESNPDRSTQKDDPGWAEDG